MSTEINARIRNIVELHQKAEKIYDTLNQKHENVLQRIAKLEGLSDCPKWE